ncbi:MAG: MFS transporter [Spirochaetaceae bacterium]|nr:MFS transporter [Spirochaetaceae bacterium]
MSDSPSLAIAKATRIDLFNYRTPAMRIFHTTWFAFFLCFFGWFGIAPLMAVVREELALTQVQIGNIIIASVAITIVARLVIGWVCDRVGPRITYTWLLLLGALPVIGIGLANSYVSFLLFRLAIGAVGASFVITQYHTSMVFAPNVVGTANATTAGWGNLGGGVTQMAMPLIFALFVTLGFADAISWRLAMMVPGIAMIVTGVLYWCLTTDTVDGNYRELRAARRMASANQTRGSFLLAARDRRVWALFVIYGACFGIELTVNNIAALYFKDYFDLGLKEAGIVAGLFGLMNIFARTLGGIFGDRTGRKWGLKGRVAFLGVVLAGEGLALILFSRMALLPMAIVTLVAFSMFVQMSEGATFSVVPFINRKALGSVAGIVGAGGNAGAVAAGFLFRLEGLPWPQALLILGATVACAASLTLLVRFSPAAEVEAREEMEERLRRARLEAAPRAA